MKKSELRYYDMTAPEWLIKKTEWNPVVLVRDVDVDAGIWMYKFYESKELKKGNLEPYLVIFKDKSTWLNYYPQDERWGKASLEHMYDYKLYKYWQVLKNLRSWQDKKLRARTAVKKRVEMNNTAQVMSLVPELPEDFKEFCEEKVMEDANYLVYSSKRKKVYCTRCKQEYDLQDLIRRNDVKPKHGYKAMCDKCLVRVEAISENMSRRGRYFRRSTEIMQPWKDGIVVRRFNIFRDFNESLTPETYFQEQQRIVFEGEKKGKYEMRWDGKGNRKWYKIKPGRYFTTVMYYEGMTYAGNVEEVINNYRYRNRGMIEYCKKHGVSMREGFVGVLERISAHPSLEQIIKAGLYELAEEMISGHIYRDLVREDETELTKMLQINREQLRWVRCRKRMFEALNILQQANEKGIYISEKELDVYLQSGCGWMEKEFIFNNTINVKKACDYILEQEITIRDFKDHMDLLTKLKLPLKKKWLYPKDFKKAHQEEIEMDILQNDKVSLSLQRQYKKTYSRWKQIAKKVKMHDDTYQIVFPTDCTDIKIEGKTLHHCVGNYVERAAKGNTVILFMRSIEDPEKRLYTMEYRDGKLIQIRASCNGDPTEQARQLAEQFALAFAAAEKKYVEQEKKKLQKAAV